MGGTLRFPRRLFWHSLALPRAAALPHTVLDAGVTPT